MFSAPDLMTFLRARYQEDVERQKKDATDKGLEDTIKPTLSEFIRFARKYLAVVNQPLNVTYLPKGLGLRLQQGETVGFVVQAETEQHMRDEGIPITRPRTTPGMHGISDTGGIEIFGGR
jgi:hypothetical protein